jgi:hypothetical protein
MASKALNQMILMQIGRIRLVSRFATRYRRHSPFYCTILAYHGCCNCSTRKPLLWPMQKKVSMFMSEAINVCLRIIENMAYFTPEEYQKINITFWKRRRKKSFRRSWCCLSWRSADSTIHSWSRRLWPSSKMQEVLLSNCFWRNH